MKLAISGKGLDVTSALKEHVQKKLGKLDKYLNEEQADAQVTLSVENETHKVEVTVFIEGDYILRAEEGTGDMYVSVDQVVDKLERQIKKYKTKLNRKLRQTGHRTINSDNLASEESSDPRIVRTKKFAIKPMSPEEAVLQMDLLGHDFFVFRNATTEEVNVVYKRKDGNYGQIEPEV